MTLITADIKKLTSANSDSSGVFKVVAFFSFSLGHLHKSTFYLIKCLHFERAQRLWSVSSQTAASFQVLMRDAGRVCDMRLP